MNSFHRNEDTTATTTPPNLTKETDNDVPEIALVKNPTDPNSPDARLVLGVSSPRRRPAPPRPSAEEEKDAPSDRVWSHPPRPPRPTCVPSTVARCFCTVDILYE